MCGRWAFSLTWCYVIVSCLATAGTVCPFTDVCDCEPSTDNSMQIINCRRRNLKSIPQFGQSAQLYDELTLAGNSIESIPNGAFQNIRFRKLDITENMLKSISPSAFSGLATDLIEIRFQLHIDADFPTLALSQLQNLQILDVVSFGKSYLPSQALTNLRNLKELSFRNGRLGTLNVQDISAQQNTLNLLTLNENQFTAIPTVVIASLRQLRTFNMLKNKLSNLPQNVFGNAPVLQSVDLSNNPINIINSLAFTSVKDVIQKLILLSCGLRDSSLQAFAKLTNLRELNLAHNSIVNIPGDIFSELSSLNKLLLNNNQLSAINKYSFYGSHNSLQTLNIGFNPFSFLSSDVFSEMFALRELYLDATSGWQLDADSFASQKQTLTILSMHDTNIGDTLWHPLSTISSIEILYTSGNSITKIPDYAFRNSPRLRIIDLSQNSIESVTQKSLYGLKSSLMSLKLDYNKVAMIDKCVFYQFAKVDLFNLGLTGNPLQCNCGIKWLYDLLKTQNPFRFQTLAWSCSNPSGKRFNQLTDSDFSSCSSTDNVKCTELDNPVTDPPGINVTRSSMSQMPLILLATNVTSTSVRLEWSVIGAYGIQRFFISYEIIHGEKSKATLTLSNHIYTHILTGLTPATRYSVCVQMEIDDKWTLARESCTDVLTLSAKPTSVDESLQLKIILGAIFGGLGLILIIVLAIILFAYWNHKRKEPDYFFGNSRSELPKVGYNSKRYSRPPSAQTVIRSSGGSALEDRLEGFTQDERDRIINFLASARNSKISVISNDSEGLRNGNYLNPQYDGGPATNPGFTHNQYNDDDNHYNHIYQDIPADDVHIDSVV